MLGDLERVVKICDMLSKKGDVKFKRNGSDYDFFYGGDKLFSYYDNILTVQSSAPVDRFMQGSRIKYKQTADRYMIDYKYITKDFLRALAAAVMEKDEGNEWQE